MYGLILENVAAYIRTHYGPKVWQEILYVSGVEYESFAVHDIYSEGIVHKIILATQDVTGTPLDQLMEAIGETFYDFTAKYEYNKVCSKKRNLLIVLSPYKIVFFLRRFCAFWDVDSPI